MISLYLSDDKIKLVEGSVKSKKFYIKKLVELPTKAGSIETGNIKDPLQLSQVVQTIMNDNEIKPQKTYVVIDNSRIVFRETIVPALPPKKLKVILATEFFTDSKQKNNCIDYIIDNKFVDEDKKKKYKVHITYQSIDAVVAITKCLKEISLKVHAIDIAQNSTRKLIENFFKDNSETMMLIDYKDSFVSLFVFEKGQRKYSKSSQLNAKPSSDQFGDDEFFVSELSTNITSVVRYFESKNENSQITKVYITGNISVFNEKMIQNLSNKAKLPAAQLPCPDSIIGVDINDFNKFSCTIGATVRR